MTDQWHRACHRTDIPEDDVIGMTVNGLSIALYDVEGEIFATDDLCTHGQARLSDGFLEDGEIECPLHQGRFCVKSGKAQCSPVTEDVRSYPVRVEDDQVLISIVPA